MKTFISEPVIIGEFPIWPLLASFLWWWTFKGRAESNSLVLLGQARCEQTCGRNKEESGFVFLFCLGLGPNSAVLRAYCSAHSDQSWWDFGEYMGYWWSNPAGLCVKQMPYCSTSLALGVYFLDYNTFSHHVYDYRNLLFYYICFFNKRNNWHKLHSTFFLKKLSLASKVRSFNYILELESFKNYYFSLV